MKTLEIKSLDSFKAEVNDNLNQNINIKLFNKQGKVLKEYIGEIIEIYQSVFIVKVKNFPMEFKKSFSYIDFFTNELVYEFEK